MRVAGASVLAAVALAVPAAQAVPDRTVAVTVTMTSKACRARPTVVEPGTLAFTLSNRTKRRRLFTIAGKRSGYVPASRRGTFQVTISRGGLYRYFCISRGRIRNPRTGVLAVRKKPTPIGPPPEHRIGVRAAGSVEELFDRTTGQRFVPRGNNYVRLADQAEVGVYHSTFNLGLYDGARADAALAGMREAGYNAVRVFLNGLCHDSCAGHRTRGVSAPYAANVADFLVRAKARGLVVILTTDAVPVDTPYANLINAEPRTFVDGENLNFLTAGGVRANADFWRDFVTELLRQGAPTDAVLAYELRNEAYFDSSAKPFTLASGVFQAPNGTSYDLAEQADRDALVDDGLVYWTNEVRAAIRRVDPTALVSIGFFEPQGPNPTRQGDRRLIRTRAVIRSSAADFVDVHAYPRVNLTLPQSMQNFGIDGTEAKPVVMGETGAFTSLFPRLDEVPYDLEQWQRESCAYGLDGWLTWTWDTDEQPGLWNARSGGGVIARALGAAARPDPCAAASGPHNAALGKPATAYRSDPARPPSRAVDGNRTTNWASGDFAPQWIEIDLEAPTTISRLRFTVDQYPPGPTQHEVYGRATQLAPPLLLHTFAGYTSSGSTLEYAPSTPWHDIRYVTVRTVASPSWVGWNELELIAPA